MSTRTIWTCDRCGAESETAPRDRWVTVHLETFPPGGQPTVRHVYLHICSACATGVYAALALAPEADR